MSAAETYLEDFLDYLLIERNLASNTQEAYVRDIEVFWDFLTDAEIRHPRDVDHAVLTRYARYLTRKKVMTIVSFQTKSYLLARLKIPKYPN